MKSSPLYWARVLFALLSVVGAGCRRAGDGFWQGYVEAEYVRVAPALGGTLEQLLVARGQRVTNGQPLFVLEQASEAATWRESDQRLRQARSRLDNLTKGRRPTEIASLEARRGQAQAALELAEREGRRAEVLLADGAIARAEFDRARATREQARQALEQAEAELATARLGAREDEVRAAEAEVAAAMAAVARAQWGLEQKVRVAPADALVEDTLYRQGELVNAGAPVVSLLPPNHLKVRFFVPEAEVSRLRVGQVLGIRIDGLAQPVPARLSYVAPGPEYTPPVIYSQENRAKLVFLCEARFDAPDPAALHPGQPVEVVP